MIVILIRHGKTKGNLEHRYVGTTEESLCEEGIQILKEYKEKGLYPEVDSIYISPQIRCVETAGILYPNREYITCPDFRECNFGEFEYKNYMELRDNANYQKWIDSNGTMDFPGGEGVGEFKVRCQQGFEQMISSLAWIYGREYYVLLYLSHEVFKDREYESISCIRKE